MSKIFGSKTALMIAATACILIPKDSSAYKVGYIKPNIPDSLKAQAAAEDSLKLERIVSQSNFPNSFNFFYVIPQNEEGLIGNFKLNRNSAKTELEIRVIDENADKLFNFSEERVGDSIFYYESEFDYPQNRCLYQNRIGFSKSDRSSTVVSLAEQVLNREIPHPSFVFQGSSKYQKKYKLKTTSNIENGYDLILTGEIEDNNSRKVPKVIVSFKEVSGKMIPVEIEVFYKLNWLDTGLFGKIHVTPNIRGVITEKP